MISRRCWTLILLACSTSAAAATLQVGPGQTYSKPCQAIAAANPGDTIEVDAAGNGTYDGDSCAWSTDALTVTGINGRASINAGGTPVGGAQSDIAQDKGIFVIAAPNATIVSFELSGAVADPSSNNGAGIRHQGTNLTVRDCYIHDNQDGILGSPSSPGTGTVLIQNSEFARNGAGDGYSHNLYIGDYALFVLQFSYSHESVIGHLVKSRALETHLEYNFLGDLSDGTGSYEVDIPQGGLTYLIGNAIEQSDAGAYAGNPTIISYAEESQANPIEQLYLVSNTVVNDANKGLFVYLGGTPQVTMTDNIFRGAGTLPTSGTLSHNWSDSLGDPLLVNQASYQYQLQAGSPCIDAGIDPGSTGSVALEPIAQYVAPLSGETRDNAHWDIGAFEYQDQGQVIDGGLPSESASTGGISTSTTGVSTSTTNSTTGAAASSTSSSTGTAVAASSTGGTSGKASVSSSSSASASTGSAGSALPQADGGAGKAAASGCGCAGSADSSWGLWWLAVGGLALWSRARSSRA